MTDNTDESGSEIHNTHIVVWDVPSAIECGENFGIKAGVKCCGECRPDDWLVEICDHAGDKLASATLSDEPLQNTTALYGAEVELTAPESQGLHAWIARVAATDSKIPHSGCITGFSVRAVPASECVVMVKAIDQASQAPVKGARVVVHPYRTFTDECGLARLAVPKGEYRLFVSGKNYFPFCSDNDVRTDITIEAKLVVDRELPDADIWA